MTDKQKLRRVIADALQLAAPTLRQLADELDVSYDLLRRYAIEDRTAPPELVEALAASLERRGRASAKMAKRLRAATSSPKPGGKSGKT